MINQTFICVECKKEKDLKFFYKKPLLSTGHDRKCKACRNIKSDDWESRPENRLKRKDYAYRRLYKMSYNEVQEFKRIHNYQCDICHIDEKNCKNLLGIDHDHKTGKIRGLLCNRHNKGLGIFQDSIELLEIAIDYLKRRS